MRSLCVSLLLLAIAGASARECVGNNRPDLDSWCDLNCNFIPPWCPEQECTCTDSEPTPLPGDGCFGATSPLFDEWCDLNCNHDPAFCPPAYCRCAGDAFPSPSPEPNQCRSLSRFLSDSYCTTMCNFDPPFCPSQYCSCDENTDYNIDIQPHTPSCCEEPIDMYYIESGDVYHQRLDFFTHLPMGEATLCGDFAGAIDIEIDSNHNIFVADQVGGKVVRITEGCSFSNTVTSWPEGPIGSPSAIGIGHNGLFVADHSALYFVELNQDYEANMIHHLDWTDLNVDGIHMGVNGTIYFVDQGAGIKMYDPATDSVSTYIAINQYRIPDIKDVKVTENCGVFISVTDSNQIWRCSDPMDGSTCEMWCQQDFENLDGSSCINMNNPFGITVDCQCRVYSAQAGNGNVLLHSFEDGMQTSQLLHSGLNFTTDVEIFIEPACSVTPTRSFSSTPSRTPSPSVSPSPDTPPTAEYCVRSDNENNPGIARDGDTITVTITANEPINAPTVVCNNITFMSVVSEDNVTFVATAVVSNSEMDGPMECTVDDIVDQDGMPTAADGPATVLTPVNCEVVVDNTHPTTEYCVETTDDFNDEAARAADTVFVTVTASESITEPTVICNGNTYAFQSSTSGNTEYLFSRVVQDGDAETSISCTITNYFDDAGNPEEEVADQIFLDTCNDVVVDTTHPTLEYCVESDNHVNSDFARAGDTVTVTITASESVTDPTVICNGNTYTLQSSTSGNTEFVYTYVVQDGDTESQIVCSITNYFDNAGNAGEDAPVEDATCGDIVVDTTEPASLFCVETISGDEVAGNGDVITITVAATEPVTVPSIICDGELVTITSGVDGDTTFEGTYVVTSASTEGELVCTCTEYVDLAGNDGTDGVQSANPSCITNIQLTPTPSITPSNSPTSSATPSISESATSSISESATSSISESATSSISESATSSISESATSSISESATPSISESATSSISESATSSISESATSSISESSTPSISESATSSISESSTPSISESATSSISESVTPSISESATSSISESSTPSISESATSSISESSTPSISESATSSISESPTPSISESATSSISESSTPSISESPTASITESATSSISESPTASISRSPTSSISRSPTSSISITPSISPSPSALYSMAIAIDDYNSECVVGECGYNSTIALIGSESSRKFGINVFIFSRLSIFADLSSCDQTSDFSGATSTILCRRRVDPNTYLPATPFVSSNVALFFRLANGGQDNLNLPPNYQIAPSIREPEEFPNASPFRIIAAQVDCTGFQGKTFRIVWIDPLPCWDDEFFPSPTYTTCVPKRSSDVSEPSAFVDADLNPQPPRQPSKDVLCPLTNP